MALKDLFMKSIALLIKNKRCKQYAAPDLIPQDCQSSSSSALSLHLVSAHKYI